MSKQILLRKLTFAFILSLTVLLGNSQNTTIALKQFLAGWQTDQKLAHAGISFAIAEVNTGKTLIQSEPQLSLIPASIMKVITTATALEVFGPEYQFSTTLAYSGIIRNDTLFGDLQIIGGGDPTLGSEYFPEPNRFLDEWKTAIQESGIKVIAGNLILDASIYESQSIPNTWIWEDLGNYFGAGASGISVFDNKYEIHLRSGSFSGKPTEITRIVPEIPNLDIRNEVFSSDLQSDQAYVFGNPEDSRRIIRGTIPKNRNDFTVRASVPNPAALLASEFRKKLDENLISISGEIKLEKAVSGENSAILTTTKSPELNEIIRITNYESVNLFAEHLLKHLAWNRNGLGTTDDGCKFIQQFWKEKGVDLNGFFMNDGSGLSRFNAITAGQMISVLNYMKTKSKYSAEFYQLLATVGKGTITYFSAEKFPNQCLRAKSGSMTRVRCYAGYLTGISGRELSFAIMLNNFSCSQREAIRKIEEVLIELRKL